MTAKNTNKRKNYSVLRIRFENGLIVEMHDFKTDCGLSLNKFVNNAVKTHIKKMKRKNKIIKF